MRLLSRTCIAGVEPPSTVSTEPSPKLWVSGGTFPKPLPKMVIVCKLTSAIGLTEEINGDPEFPDVAF